MPVMSANRKRAGGRGGGARFSLRRTAGKMEVLLLVAELFREMEEAGESLDLSTWNR